MRVMGGWNVSTSIKNNTETVAASRHSRATNDKKEKGEIDRFNDTGRFEGFGKAGKECSVRSG